MNFNFCQNKIKYYYNRLVSNFSIPKLFKSLVRAMICNEIKCGASSSLLRDLIDLIHFLRKQLPVKYVHTAGGIFAVASKISIFLHEKLQTPMDWVRPSF